MDDLISAVDALTKPSRTKVVRDDGTTTVVRHDALLVQLEAAVTSAVGTDAGTGGQSTGNVINGSALYLLSIISSQIGDWCRIAKVKPTRKPVDDLARWRVAALSMPEVTFYVDALRRWADDIKEMLDPPKRIPLVDPCVACGAAKYVTPEGDERPPVVVEYHQVSLHASLRAVCRACELTWTGADAVEELVAEMKERHPETTRVLDE